MGRQGSDDRRATIVAMLVGVGAVALGQLVLLLLTPLSRAASPGIGRVGVALLSSDSDVYLDLAATSDWSSRTPWNRLLLIGILRVGTIIGEPAMTLVILQSIAFSAATALAFIMARRVADLNAGLLAAAIVAVNPLTAQWVRFVLSETLMFALVVIGVWAADRILRTGADRRAVVHLLAPALLATFLRPNGILLVGSALTVLVIRGRRHRLLLSVTLWIGVAAGLALGLMAAGQPAERPFTEQLYTGTVVDGTDDVRLTISMPAASDSADVSNTAGLRYVLSEPVAVARLAVTRLVSEIAQVRRHYPLAVNVAIGSAMGLLVIATTAGLRGRPTAALRTAALAYAVPVLLLVGATFSSPEGRYGWGGMIALAPIAGVGAARILATLGPLGVSRRRAPRSARR